jgi:hypothetical protein
MKSRILYIACLLLIILAILLRVSVLKIDSSSTFLKVRLIADKSILSESERLELTAKFQSERFTAKILGLLEYLFAFLSLIFWFFSFKKKEPVWHSIPFVAYIFFVLIHFVVT